MDALEDKEGVPVSKIKIATQEQCSCKDVTEKKSLKQLVTLDLFESYDLREDNKIGMD